MSSSAESVEIAVADKGEGIATEDLPNVFERFWRTNPVRTRTGSNGEERFTDGSGLGLIVAQSLVEAQGGRIWAKAHRGKGRFYGSRFLLTSAAIDSAWASSPVGTRESGHQSLSVQFPDVMQSRLLNIVSGRVVEVHRKRSYVGVLLLWTGSVSIIRSGRCLELSLLTHTNSGILAKWQY